MAKLDKVKAQEALKEIAKEAVSLEASSVITLYEIDVSGIQANLNIGSAPIEESVLRFHNIEVLNQRVIYFKGDAYHPVPIMTDGFEVTSAGSLARPTLTFASIKAIEDRESNNQFASLKRAILELDNMIGAKVTRIRTFLKFLDAKNNFEEAGQFNTGLDNNPEFPRDVFYIERKMAEEKSTIQFELSSVLDLENFKLPGRLCLASRCPWTYRGQGCCYEYKSEGSAEEHGATEHLPEFASPIANDEDKLLTEVVGYWDPNNPKVWVPQYNPETLKASDVTEYDYDKTGGYSAGSVVYIKKDGIRYYYVSKIAVPSQTGPPPNSTYWEADRCSKTMKGCKLRWGKNGQAKNCTDSANPCARGVANKFLPFGGFPGTNTKTTVQ